MRRSSSWLGSIVALSLVILAAASPLDFSTQVQLEPRVASSSTINKIRGVNLGGWLLTEQWITPGLYENSGASTTPSDEWTLCAALGKSKCLSSLSTHWSSFYTENDFSQMSSYGLNYIRIPIGYWAIVPIESYEPYVTGQYEYLKLAVQWCYAHNLKVWIDLHGAPGSQNGQDNSGLQGSIQFGANSTNYQRSLAALKNLTTEFTMPYYNSTVTAIELLNEPRLNTIPGYSMLTLKDFYTNGTQIVLDNNATQVGVAVHDAFYGPSYWENYDPLNSTAKSSPTYLTLDTHQYYAFAPLNNLSQLAILQSICNISRILSASTLLPTVVGEWSLAGGSLVPTGTSQNSRTWYRLLFESQINAYEKGAGWFWWCWKTEYGYANWDYRVGVQKGWIPLDVSNLTQRVYPTVSAGDLSNSFADCVDPSYTGYIAPSAVPSRVSISSASRVLSLPFKGFSIALIFALTACF